MALKFHKRTLHGKFEMLPGVAYGFEDEDAEPYFLALGWAESTTDAPARTYAIGEIDIDPLTIRASDGKHVLPERAATELARREKLKAEGKPVAEPQVIIRPKG
jgi:hypothetical protein